MAFSTDSISCGASGKEKATREEYNTEIAAIEIKTVFATLPAIERRFCSSGCIFIRFLGENERKAGKEGNSLHTTVYSMCL